jgi:N-acetylneuraminic acid mutarotase
MIADEADGSLLLFGGADYVFELNPGFFQSFTPNNTLWSYQLDSQQWTQLTPTGTPPSPRNGCSAVRVGNSMYVFGGLSRFLHPNNELWRYDIAGNAWEQLAPAGPLPPPRFIASAAVDPEAGRIYVYNGLAATAQGFSQIGDFWVYDIAGGAWRQLATAPTPPRNKGVFSELRGPCGKNYLVYSTGNVDTDVRCTGFDEDTTAINEIWAFDLEAETWQQLESVGTAPRLNFAQGATLKNRQVLLGGWYDVPDPVRICRQVWSDAVYTVSLVDR